MAFERAGLVDERFLLGESGWSLAEMAAPRFLGVVFAFVFVAGLDSYA